MANNIWRYAPDTSFCRSEIIDKDQGHSDSKIIRDILQPQDTPTHEIFDRYIK